MEYAVRITDTDSIVTPGEIRKVAYSANKVLAMANTGKHIIACARKHIITVPVSTLADIANSSVLAVKVPFPFTLDAVNFRVGSKAVTTAARAATLTAQVAGVSVTGGAIAITSANATPSGAAVAGSSITAGNTGAANDTVGVIASSVTAFAEGNGLVEFLVTELSE